MSAIPERLMDYHYVLLVRLFPSLACTTRAWKKRLRSNINPRKGSRTPEGARTGKNTREGQRGQRKSVKILVEMRVLFFLPAPQDWLWPSTAWWVYVTARTIKALCRLVSLMPVHYMYIWSNSMVKGVRNINGRGRQLLLPEGQCSH